MKRKKKKLIGLLIIVAPIVRIRSQQMKCIFAIFQHAPDSMPPISSCMCANVIALHLINLRNSAKASASPQRSDFRMHLVANRAHYFRACCHSVRLLNRWPNHRLYHYLQEIHPTGWQRRWWRCCSCRCVLRLPFLGGSKQSRAIAIEAMQTTNANAMEKIVFWKLISCFRFH